MNHKVVNVFGWIMIVLGVVAAGSALTDDTVNTLGLIGGFLYLSQGSIIIYYSGKALKENRQTELDIAVQAELVKRGI